MKFQQQYSLLPLVHQSQQLIEREKKNNISSYNHHKNILNTGIALILWLGLISSTLFLVQQHLDCDFNVMMKHKASSSSTFTPIPTPPLSINKNDNNNKDIAAVFVVEEDVVYNDAPFEYSALEELSLKVWDLR